MNIRIIIIISTIPNNPKFLKSNAVRIRDKTCLNPRVNLAP